jgi:GNAT superfamily N-acetyltransferase
MGDLQIRAAGHDDVEILVAARVGMFTDMGEDEPASLAATAEGFRSYLASALDDGSFEAWVEEEDGAWVGSAAAVFYRLPPNPRNRSGTMAHVLNVYVRPSDRRRGVATALLRHARARCTERGVGIVDLVASDEGRPVYERLGFSPSAGMRRRIVG